MKPILPCYSAVGWYFFWLAVILCCYKSGLQMFPKKDHFFFMLGRQLFDSDLVWFFKTLSYNRTRIFFPGDYFAFRPVLMAVLGLEDIFLRHRLLELGLIGCSLFSFTATAFFLLARRIAGLLPALFLTLIWSANLAGSEMLLWHHISAYVLAPGFLCLALILLTGDHVGSRQRWGAGLLVLGACLTHEICVIVCGSFAVITWFMLRGQPEARRPTTLTFLLPTVSALALNAVDYLMVHPPPALLGPADSPNIAHIGVLLDSLWSFVGAIGVALVAPWGVQITLQHDWSHLWKFSGINPWLLIACGTLVLMILAAAAFQVSRDIWHGQRVDMVPLATAMFLLFFLAAFAVCFFRLITRGVDYLYEATYYFSYFVIALCGILSVFFAQIPAQRTRHTATIFMAVMAAFQIMSLRTFLGTTGQARTATENLFRNVRAEIGKNSQVCLAGLDTIGTPGMNNRWIPLFQDLSCTERPDAAPLYLSSREGTPALFTLENSAQPSFYRDVAPVNATSPAAGSRFSTVLEYGTPFEFTLSKSPAFSLVLSGRNGLRQSLHVDYNVVSILRREREFTPLTFNPGSRNVSYRVEFTQHEVVFLANNNLVTSLPREQKMEGATVSVALFTRQGATAISLVDFRAAQQPETTELRLLPAIWVSPSQN